MIAREMRGAGADARLAFQKMPGGSHDPATFGCETAGWVREIPRSRGRAALAIAVDRWGSSDHIITSDLDGYRVWRKASRWLIPGGAKGVPYSAFIHGTEMRNNPFMPGEAAEGWKAFLSGAAHVFHCQPDLEKFARRLGLNNTMYVPTPIDTDFWQPSGSSGKRFEILHPVEHYWGHKGNDKLIRAFAMLAEIRDDVCLRIIQSGTDFGRSMVLAESLGIEDRVTVSGYMGQPELKQAVQRSSVVADSFSLGVVGMVGLQGMACNKPVVCYAHVEEYRQAGSPTPPVMLAHTEEEIFQRLIEAYDGNVPAPARKWVIDNHRPSVAAASMMHALASKKANPIRPPL